jgi:hypothetical protein
VCGNAAQIEYLPCVCYAQLTVALRLSCALLSQEYEQMIKRIIW